MLVLVLAGTGIYGCSGPSREADVTAGSSAALTEPVTIPEDAVRETARGMGAELMEQSSEEADASEEGETALNASEASDQEASGPSGQEETASDISEEDTSGAETKEDQETTAAGKEPETVKADREPEASGADGDKEDAKADRDLEASGANKEETAQAEKHGNRRASEYAAGEVVPLKDVEAAGTGNFFYQTSIGEALYQRMDGNSYKSGCPVAVEELRYLRVLHYGYQGEIRVGELVCNQSVSDDMLSIFRKLYEARYPIEKILLIDNYGGDDDRSSSDNNTSCFNYRNVAGTKSLSLHAYGVAIDVNPVRNPYVVTDEEGNVICAPANGSRYIDRSASFSHKIDEEDLCYKLFTEAGFTWGGSWVNEPDYMHFSRK